MRNSFKNNCLELREKDYTLNEIVRITGRPKTSVYFHIQDIPLSNKKQKQIHKESSQRLRLSAQQRKGKSNKKFKRFQKWDEKKISLVSHLLFDGEITKRRCVYNNRSEALVEKLKKNMRGIYEYKPSGRLCKASGVMSVGYYNVELANYLKRKSESLLEEIGVMSLKFKREFLKAFFDDEGCMDFNKGTRRIRGYQHNVKILKIIQSLLKELDIESTIRESGKEIVVSQRKNIEKFAQEINFSPGVKINGKRKNSIWKKSLEKRNILKMAINSYKK